MSLFKAVTLPNGNVIKNRIAKCATDEGLITSNHSPSEELIRLYKRWADGGAGLLIVGNVMVESESVTAPDNLILEDEKEISKFRRLALMAKANYGQAWLQLNHPGDQMPRNLDQPIFGPSRKEHAGLKPNIHNSRQPLMLTDNGIEKIIARFAKSAAIAEKAGFTGVQIQAGDRFLISQFLSPDINHRKDKWGGTPECRAKLLLDIVRRIKVSTSRRFSVGVKFSTTDFDTKLLKIGDLCHVVSMLELIGIDHLEISNSGTSDGFGRGVKYCRNTSITAIDLVHIAAILKRITTAPLMLTGGVNKKSTASRIVKSGVDMVGVASAITANPDLPFDWLIDREDVFDLPRTNWKNKRMAQAADSAIARWHWRRIAHGDLKKRHVEPLQALLRQEFGQTILAATYRRWIDKRIFLSA